MHNILAASDYGLLDQNTLEPRPNYWATLLWHKLMDTTVLDPQVTVAPKRAQKRTSFLIRQLNVRTFDEDVRKTVLAAIERIVNVEAEASRAPKKPEITPLDRYSVHGHNRSRCLELLRWVPLRNRGRHRPRYLRSVLTFWLARKLHAS